MTARRDPSPPSQMMERTSEATAKPFVVGRAGMTGAGGGRGRGGGAVVVGGGGGRGAEAVAVLASAPIDAPHRGQKCAVPGTTARQFAHRGTAHLLVRRLETYPGSRLPETAQ